jgi:hypothetical protein
VTRAGISPADRHLNFDKLPVEQSPAGTAGFCLLEARLAFLRLSHFARKAVFTASA